MAARCQALGLSRSSFYYQPCGESTYNLDLLGLRDHLRLAGHAVNATRVRRLVRLMGHEPGYPKPRLSVPGQGLTSYPYLLRDRPATAPNEVWSTDITYVPMAKGFLYLAAVLDWHSRYVLSWQLSNTGQPVYEPGLRAGPAGRWLPYQPRWPGAGDR